MALLLAEPKLNVGVNLGQSFTESIDHVARSGPTTYSNDHVLDRP